MSSAKVNDSYNHTFEPGKHTYDEDFGSINRGSERYYVQLFSHDIHAERMDKDRASVRAYFKTPFVANMNLREPWEVRVKQGVFRNEQNVVAKIKVFRKSDDALVKEVDLPRRVYNNLWELFEQSYQSLTNMPVTTNLMAINEFTQERINIGVMFKNGNENSLFFIPEVDLNLPSLTTDYSISNRELGKMFFDAINDTSYRWPHKFIWFFAHSQTDDFLQKGIIYDNEDPPQDVPSEYQLTVLDFSGAWNRPNQALFLSRSDGSYTTLFKEETFFMILIIRKELAQLLSFKEIVSDSSNDGFVYSAIVPGRDDLEGIIIQGARGVNIRNFHSWDIDSYGNIETSEEGPLQTSFSTSESGDIKVSYRTDHLIKIHDQHDVMRWEGDAINARHEDMHILKDPRLVEFFKLTNMSLEVDELTFNHSSFQVGTQDSNIAERDWKTLVENIYLDPTKAIVIYNGNRRMFLPVVPRIGVNAITIQLRDKNNKQYFSWFNTGFTHLVLEFRRNWSDSIEERE